METQLNTDIIVHKKSLKTKKPIDYDSFETKSFLPLIVGIIVLHVLLFILLSPLFFTILFAIEVFAVSIHLYLGFRIVSQDYQDNC